MLTLTMIGLVVMALGPLLVSKFVPRGIGQEIDVNQHNKIQGLQWGVRGLGIVMFLYSVFNGMYFYAEPGYKYHVRTIWGTESAIDSVGYSVKGFGPEVKAWKKAMSVQAIARDFEEEGDVSSAEFEYTSASLPPQNIVFLDQVDANAQATVRFRLPADEATFLTLVHEYRTPANFLNTSLIPAFRETLQATGSMMSAEEYYSGGRTEFNTEFENQMNNGIYIVKRMEVVVEDPSAQTPASANASKGMQQERFGSGKKVVFRVKKQFNADGSTPMRKTQKFTTFGVQVVDARITNMLPNVKFKERMELKQQASADRAIAREKRVQEEEQKHLAVAKGQREVAERQAKAQVEQIEQTTNAETTKQLALTKAQQQKEQAAIDKDTAIIRLEQAKIDAEAVKVMADAEAYKKQAIIKADNALAQKLEAYVETQRVWADAFARRNVPTQMFGSAGSAMTGTDGDVQTFMKLMTMRAAQELSFDQTISREGQQEEGQREEGQREEGQREEGQQEENRQ